MKFFKAIKKYANFIQLIILKNIYLAMVKLKAITRTNKDYERETKFDMHRVTRTHQRN